MTEHTKDAEVQVSQAEISAWEAFRVLLRKGRDRVSEPEDSVESWEAVRTLFQKSLLLTYAAEILFGWAYFIEDGMSEEQAAEMAKAIMGFMQERRANNDDRSEQPA